MTMTAAAPSLSGQLLPAVTSPSGRKAGLSSASFSTVVPGPGAVVGADLGAVGEGERGDLPFEEAVLLRRHGPLLRAGREVVHVLAG